MSLYLLQNIDQKIDHIHVRQQKIKSILADHSAENDVLAREETVRQGRSAIEKDLSELEKKLQATRIKLQHSENALYGGKIQSPKELQDLEAEIKLLKGSIAQYETQQFDWMLVIEQKLSDEKSLQIDREKIKTNIASDSTAYELELADLEKALEKNMVERNALTTGIDPTTRQIYENLREKKSGVAVTGLEDGTCSACGAEMTQAEWQRARISQDLCYCGTCGRIVYAK